MSLTKMCFWLSCLVPPRSLHSPSGWEWGIEITYSFCVGSVAGNIWCVCAVVFLDWVVLCSPGLSQTWDSLASFWVLQLIIDLYHSGPVAVLTFSALCCLFFFPDCVIFFFSLSFETNYPQTWGYLPASAMRVFGSTRFLSTSGSCTLKFYVNCFRNH